MTTLQPDFSTVTETPFTRATRDQLQIMYTRYHLAAQYGVGKDALEVACGAGTGVGLLARSARHIVGGDIDERNYRIAAQTYKSRSNVEIKQIDAQELPFSDGSFDLVILYEAIYYIPSPESFFREARRVLRSGGTLLLSTVNCRWDEFNPSPFSLKYFDAAELSEALTRNGFVVEMRGGFLQESRGRLGALINLIRRAAVRLRLVPRTMKGKEWLKRIFYGALKPIPAELTPGVAVPAPLHILTPPYLADHYRFIYAIGTRQ